MDVKFESLSTHIEVQKVVMDYIKHLTGLATGSIILLTILLEKFFDYSNVEFSQLVGASFICFLISVLMFSLCSLGIINSMRSENANSLSNKKYSVFTFVLGLLLYFSGLVCLSVFAIVNWY